MSQPLPERADIRQLKIQAKELLRKLQSGETLYEGMPFAQAKLADAQRITARDYGFDSWPKLVDAVETPVLVTKFKQAVEIGDAAALEHILKTSAAVRRVINDPLFHFDSPAVLRAANHPAAAKVLPILVRYGADVNVRSSWWAGGFGALDHASADAANLLVSMGATYDVWSAAAQGKIDVLRALLDSDPASVDAPGGDGQRPLHVAATPEIAELLIERGANLELKDVDHESTPIQYQINNLEIVRVLLSHGAVPDIFTAVVLDDLPLFNKIIAQEPDAATAAVGRQPFVTKKSNGGHIYTYLLGSNKSPIHVAAERGSSAVLAELTKSVSPARQLVAAALTENEAEVDRLLSLHPDLGKNMGVEARAITDAAQAGNVGAVRLFLKAGLDPTAQGLDSGTALHTACWYGQLEVVRLLIGLVPLDLTDSVHGSPPLGWVLHGSNWCRNPAGDYVGAARLLLQSGADQNAPANSSGTTMLAQAGNRDDMKAVLREFR